MAFSLEEQKLLSEIDVTRANLYVFRDSGEKIRWADLLDKAEKAVKEENYVYAQDIVNRIKEVIDNLWRRIFKWQDAQRKITKVFMIVIPVELIMVIGYSYFLGLTQYGLFTSMVFGLLGGSLGVSLTIGKDLQIDGSNNLQILRLMLRPFIGVISAILMYALLQTKILTIAPSVDSGSLLIVLSLFAGYSERFIVKAMSDYIPSIIKDSSASKSASIK